MTVGGDAAQGGSPPETKSGADIRLLLLVFLIGITLRYVFVARDFVITNDSVEYLDAARRIENEGLDAVKSLGRQPLYPLTLWTAARLKASFDGSFAWRSGELAEVGRWTSVALYPLFLLAAYLVFTRALSPRLAALALLILVLHPLFGVYFTNVLSETPYLAFFLLGLWCLLEASAAAASSRAAAFAWGLAGGAATVLAYMTRVEGQILAVAALSYFGGTALAAWRRREASETRGRALAALGLMVAVILPVLVFFALTGATSVRYSWEWLYARLTQADGGAAGAQLGTSPGNALRLLVRALLAHTPEITIVTTAAICHWVWRRSKGRPAEWQRPGHGLLLVVCGWYFVAIFAGVAIQNGVVSQRYIQPVAVMALPVAVAFVAGFVPVSRRSAKIVTALAVAATVTAFVSAAGKWSEYKIGLRDAGLAISRNGTGSRVLTSAPRVAFYADSPSGTIAESALESSILSGAASQYDYVVIEARRFSAENLRVMEETLRSQGFAVERRMEFREDRVKRDTRRVVVVYAKDSTGAAPARP